MHMRIRIMKENSTLQNWSLSEVKLIHTFLQEQYSEVNNVSAEVNSVDGFHSVLLIMGPTYTSLFSMISLQENICLHNQLHIFIKSIAVSIYCWVAGISKKVGDEETRDDKFLSGKEKEKKIRYMVTKKFHRVCQCYNLSLNQFQKQEDESGIFKLIKERSIL